MPKNKTRTIKVTVVEELPVRGGVARFECPLTFPKPIDSYSYSVCSLSESYSASPIK